MAHLALSDTDFGKLFPRKSFVSAGQMSYFAFKPIVM